jgi:hypothetical protein
MFFRSVKKLVHHISVLQPTKDIKDNDLEYLLWLTNLYCRIKNLPGHVAEVGVADGRNTVIFGKLIELHNDQSVRQYIGFDTFEGFASRDLDRDLHLDENAWKSNSKIAVLDRCINNNIDSYIELIEGDAVVMVPKVLKDHTGRLFQKGKGRFALVYIDCNAYIPAIESMKCFLPHMVPGGVFAIDEKFQGGESEALLDFATENKLQVQRLGTNEVPMSITLPL